MAEDFDVLDGMDVSTGMVTVTHEYTMDIPLNFNGLLFLLFLHERYASDGKHTNTHIKNMKEERWVNMENAHIRHGLRLYLDKAKKEHDCGDNGGFDIPYDERITRNYMASSPEAGLSITGDSFVISYPDDSTVVKNCNILVTLRSDTAFLDWLDFIETYDPVKYAAGYVRNVGQDEMIKGPKFTWSDMRDIAFPHSGHYFRKNRGKFVICTVGCSPEEDDIEPIIQNYRTLIDRMRKIAGEYRKFISDVRTGRYFRSFKSC